MNQTSLIALLAPVAVRCGLELETVELIPAGKRRLVRVVIDGDGPDGSGPTLDQVAEATKAISTALDDSDLTGSAPYTLEVTSRGVSRPLERAPHWRRNRGRLVQVLLRSGEQFTGRIVTVEATSVTLEVAEAARELPLADVAKAVVQVEFNRPVGADPDREED